MTSPSADAPVPEATELTLTPADRLHVLQRLHGTEDDLRARWARELHLLAGVIRHNPNDRGLILGAMGGITYLLDVLSESLEGKSLDELVQVYAEVELQSYARTEAEAAQTRRNYERLGLQVVVDPIRFPDGYMCYRMTSAVNQVSKEGTKYRQGELLHSADRFPPPLTSLF